MGYSKVYLEELQQVNIKEHPERAGEFQIVLQSLLDRLAQGDSLTLTEERYTCGALATLQPNPIDPCIHYEQQCKRHCFIDKYLLYFNNLDGYKPAYDITGEISISQKRKDVAFLEQQYISWRQTLGNYGKQESLLDYITRETNHHTNNLNKYCIKAGIGFFYKQSLLKSIYLHSKYIYLLVEDFPVETGLHEILIDIGSDKILIDNYSFVHILFRHYAEHIKMYLLGKSYHYRDIDFKTIPSFLGDIIDTFKNEIPISSFNRRAIDFIYQNKSYTIWLREINKSVPGNVVNKYLRVQTFYPVKEPSDIKRIGNMQEIAVNNQLSFLV